MNEDKRVAKWKDQVRECPCEECQKDPTGKIATNHRHLNFMMNVLNERDRRLVAGYQSELLGYGGDKTIAEITGLDVKTIRKGREEISTQTVPKTVRQPGGGRASKKKDVNSSGSRRTHRR
jgi:hypothetical protein